MKYVRFMFSDGKFKIIKGVSHIWQPCKEGVWEICEHDCSCESHISDQFLIIDCDDGRKYYLNIQHIMEFKLWEEEEKPNPKDPESPLYFVTVGNPVEMLVNGEWIKGHIVEGYRSEAEYITIETKDGQRYFCGQDRKDLVRPYKEDENEKPKRSRKRVSTKTAGDNGTGCGDQEASDETSGTPGDDD